MKIVTAIHVVLACLVVSATAQNISSYQSVVTSHSPSHYFKLDNSLVDSTGSAAPLIVISGPSGFTNDIAGQGNHAYFFNSTTTALMGTNTLINGAGPGIDATATATGSLSFLFRMLDDTNNTGQRYIFSQGTNSSTRNQLGFFIENNSVANGDPNSLKLRIGSTTVTVLTNQFLVPAVWYYFAMTYNLARNNDEVHWYIGRVGDVLLNGTNNISNDAIIADSSLNLVLGNRSSTDPNALSQGFRNPGVGTVDEFATWDRELSESELNAQFNSLSGSVTPSPVLSIALSGNNVIVSWPTNDAAGFNLEAASALPAISWTSAGSPSVVGSNYQISILITPGESRFYRLNKP